MFLSLQDLSGVMGGGDAMRSLGMAGPYRLDDETIEREVRETSAGNYALGNRDPEGQFVVGYVGRADADLRARLKAWVGRTERPVFKYRYARSAEEAFRTECEEYHEFHPPENERHPARPDGTDWRCPRCGVFG